MKKMKLGQLHQQLTTFIDRDIYFKIKRQNATHPSRVALNLCMLFNVHTKNVNISLSGWRRSYWSLDLCPLPGWDRAVVWCQLIYSIVASLQSPSYNNQQPIRKISLSRMSRFLIKGDGGEKAELRRRIEVISRLLYSVNKIFKKRRNKK